MNYYENFKTFNEDLKKATYNVMVSNALATHNEIKSKESNIEGLIEVIGHLETALKNRGVSDYEIHLLKQGLKEKKYS